MMLMPELPLRLLGLPVEGVDCIRMLGAVTFIVGYYYWHLGRADVLVFCRYSAQMRLLMPLLFVAMVLAFDMRAFYIAFTLPDILGGLWTAMALRREGLTVFRVVS